MVLFSVVLHEGIRYDVGGDTICYFYRPTLAEYSRLPAGDGARPHALTSLQLEHVVIILH